MRVGIGADHGGFEMKQQLAKMLAAEGHEVVDFGNEAYNTDDDSPDFAIPLARAAASQEVERGVLLCGSGVGASVAAIKVDGVRAALCHDDYSALHEELSGRQVQRRRPASPAAGQGRATRTQHNRLR